MTNHDYVMALAMNHDPATVIIGNTKIPVLITNVESKTTCGSATDTTFECMVVNLDNVSKNGPRGGFTNPNTPRPSQNQFAIARVYFNDPVTVVLWKDGTKTIVRCQEGDTYSAETGLALCFAKKALGNKSNFNDVFKKYVPEEDPVVLI